MRYLSITYYMKETELIHSGERSVDMKCAKYGSAVYIPYLSFKCILSRTCTYDLHEQHKQRKKRMLQEARRADMSSRGKWWTYKGSSGAVKGVKP